MGKRVLWIGVSLALLALASLGAVWVFGQATRPVLAQTEEPSTGYSPAEVITVVGYGSIKLAPDMAQVSIGVETVAEAVSDAVDENEAKMEAILAALEEAGVADKDIQTLHYSIQFERYPEPVPMLDSERAESKPQYRVSNMVNVTVRDLARVGEVLEAVVEAGANNIWGVSFGLDDRAAAEGDARTEAMADASARAGALADLAGVSLGPVMSVSEVVGGESYPVAVTVERAAMGAGSISPGEVEVAYQVQVTYFIER